MITDGKHWVYCRCCRNRLKSQAALLVGFCSDQCRHRFVERRKRVGAEPCPNCGGVVVFERLQPRKYCSRECRIEHLEDQTNDKEPEDTTDYPSTQHPPGSQEKVEVMAWRFANNKPIWHPDDRQDFDGIKGGVEARY